MSKLNYYIEGMLDKNSNLRGFVDGINKSIEKLYLKQYNMSILLGKLFKSIFVNSVDAESY